MEQWSNYACLGYLIKTLESLEMDSEQIQKAVYRMMYYFDMKTIQDAEEIYKKNDY